MKKKYFPVFFMILCIFVISCSQPIDNTNNNNNNSNDNNSEVDVKTGKVTFFNESSYTVIVHQDAFSGPVLLELSSGQSKQIAVRTSDNYGVGSTFSIEYLFGITDAFDVESGKVNASGIDPAVQLNRVIEENKSYTIQIPQPKNLEFRSAFIKIVNSSSMQFELTYLGTVFKQAGNGNISVASGKTGVYKLDGIPSEGKLYQNYTVAPNAIAENTTIPDFTARNGFIYSFTYNGTSVVKTGEQSIVFK